MQARDSVILLADDDALLLEVTREFLEFKGYQVVTACNGMEAIKQYQQHRHEIVLAIFDVVMPHLSGPEAAKHICCINNQLPFIFVTGFDKHVLEQFEIYQGFRVMHKPVNFNELSQAIQETLAASSIKPR